ncbi:MAG: dipeptidase [Gammaproteobacteria bacterium]|nr:dipeptidase [Gammaproteobacteria bacterium]MDE0256950.1 dipeptidase [Gammaproteobacteria bacterium]
MTTPRSITRRLALLATLATVACTGTSDDPAPAASAESEEEMIARASAIHERVITLDTHVDINTSNFTAERNYIMDLPTQVTLPKMEAGGLDVAWFVVFTGQGPLDDEGYAAAYDNAMDKFNSIHRLVEEYAPDRIELALTSDDVRRIAASGELVAMIGVENAYSLGLDLSHIEQFHALGTRYMSLAHTGPSQLSDAHSGEQDGNFLHGGLSEIGREAIAEMNRLGIMIDISHPSKPSIMQTLELTRAPVMASHSAARALSDVSRNLDDEQLLAVGENGGVVQTVALRRFTNRDKAETRQQAIGALAREMAAEMGVELMDDDELAERSQVEQVTYAEAMAMARRQATERVDESGTAPDVDVSDFVDHIDYLVDMIGLEHVGISSDFDGGGGVEGWDDASETFNVTLELVRRGYSEEEIGMLWSGNLLRVLDEVQAIAAEIQAGEG